MESSHSILFPLFFPSILSIFISVLLAGKITAYVAEHHDASQIKSSENIRGARSEDFYVFNNENIFKSKRQKRDVEPRDLNFEYLYSAVIDAGSSGSRIYIYKWRSDYFEQGRALPKFEEIKNVKQPGGIASITDDENKLKEHLKPLIKNATVLVPENQHASTALYFMATAGMRLLLEDKANSAINKISDILAKKSFSPFKHDPQNIRILSGEEEGTFAWLSINYNKNVFTERNTRVNKTYGILEMGGASTQIAFIPKGSILSDMFSVTIAGVTYQLYVHSFLYYGQEYVDRWIKQQIYDKKSGNVCTKNTEPHTCTTPCFVKDYVQNSTLKPGIEVKFTGTGSPEECRDMLDEYVYTYVDDDWKCSPKPCSIGSVYQPTIPTDLEFYAIGAFRFSYTRLNLLEADHKLNIAKAFGIVEKFCEMDAKRANESYPSKSYQFLSSPCLLGLYFDKLFTKGYGFPTDTKMITIEKEVDWTLGALVYEHELSMYGIPISIRASSSQSASFHLFNKMTVMMVVLLSVIIYIGV